MTAPDPLAGAHPSRRDVILLGVGAFVVAAVPFLRRRRLLTRRSVPVMGTIAELAVVHEDPPYAHRAIDAALAELRVVDRTMSRFTATSDVGRANRTAATEAVVVTAPTAAVLTEALRWAEASDGAFDPCIGKTVTLWDVTRRREPPPPERVRPLAGRRLYHHLDVDTLAGRPAVRYADRDVQIDLGAIAKGYGVDRAARALRAWGITSGLVNVGGDLYALGASEDGNPWKIGIRSPQDPSQLAGTVSVSNAAVATSGDYLQFFQHRGVRYHHLLDPSTGRPWRNTAHSVTVTADDCMTADAASTAVFGMDRVRAQRLLTSSRSSPRMV